MATRASMETLTQQVEDTIRFAEEQYKQSSLQEHYNEDDYIQALQKLETMYQDICTMAHSANGPQREQLHRMRLQVQQLQNSLILQGTRGGEQF
ncbi:YtzC family protein [Neobacillus niacini]|uniref:YtzC family protein n=1 Tax=Neobacillus niacini TaxID=86668 RepID=UPI0021CAED30|nr:YtzC family protein [Neobacillus niacini]MCM3767107.1 YtzC family protein [Neobacillus niacini]